LTGNSDEKKNGGDVKSRKKVLIIDDRKENLDVVSFFLEANGIEYVIIDEGRKALETIRNEGNSFDLILLDLAMPEFSGIDIFNELKKEGLVERNNIMLFTASSVSDAEINILLNSGAKGVLYKPVSIEELEKMVEKQLSH
jgi:CheY-like chemotaxis protein